MMPIPSKDMAEFCAMAANGNQHAADALMRIARVARLADNIADGQTSTPQEDVGEILRLCFVELASNPFYLQFAPTLAPVCLNAVLGWQQADEWAAADSQKSRIFGFVYREAIEQVAHTIAYLTGGYDHARTVMRALHQTSHLSSPETFSDWEREHHGDVQPGLS